MMKTTYLGRQRYLFTPVLSQAAVCYVHEKRKSEFSSMLRRWYARLVSKPTPPASSAVRTDENSDEVHEPEDVDPRQLIEYLQAHLRRTYRASPSFYVGTLQEALNAAASHESIEEVRLVLY
jgi:hypothetical protein